MPLPDFTILPVKELSKFADLYDNLWFGQSAPKISQQSYSKFFPILITFSKKLDKAHFAYDLISAPFLDLYNSKQIKTERWKEGDNWHLVAYRIYADQQLWWIPVFTTFVTKKIFLNSPLWSLKQLLTPEPGSFYHYIETEDLIFLLEKIEEKTRQDLQSYEDLQKWFSPQN